MNLYRNGKPLDMGKLTDDEIKASSELNRIFLNQEEMDMMLEYLEKMESN